MPRDGDFRELLRLHRIQAGLTQEALAERAGLSTRGIQNLERGERRPYPDTVARLVAALELEADDRDAFERAARPAPAARAPAELPNNLPVPLNTCIGRDADTQAALDALGSTRLATLVGAGGAGKTRLAIEIGRRIVGRQGIAEYEGVYLVELATLADPELIPRVLAATIGARDERGRPLFETVVDALAQRQWLLIMDNCEHVLAAAAHAIEELLRRCPLLRVLATSRQPLGVPGEVVRLLAPLEVPIAYQEERDVVSLDQLLSVPSVRLFVERAQAAAPGFVLHAANARDVVEVCRRLDGLPLALELAAARLRALSPAQLAGELPTNLGLLRGQPGAAPRQQSLEAAIDWSYRLLEPTEQFAFRALSVFAGGWTLASATAIAVGSGALWRLVDQSLVHVDWSAGGEPRYRLLEPVRHYAAQRLAAEGELEAARDGHLAYFLELAERAEPELHGAAQVGCLARLDLEYANFRAALGWAVEQRPEQGAWLGVALEPYWRLRGDLGEGLLWLAQVLDQAASIEPRTRARALLAAAGLSGGTEHVRAEAWLAEAAAFASADGDRELLTRIRVEQGRLRLEVGNHLGAASALRQAHITLADATGPALLRATALDLLGQAAMDRGDYAEAVTLLEASLAACGSSGERSGRASTLRHLAMCRLETGDLEGARGPLEEALWLLRELGDTVGVAWALHELGRVALDADDPSRATAAFEDALRTFRRLGHTLGAAWTINNLGRSALARGKREDARALFEEALALFRRLEHMRGIGWAVYNLAWLAADVHPPRARLLLDEARPAFERTQHPLGIAACLALEARLLADTDPDLGVRKLIEAFQLRAAIGARVVGADRERAEVAERALRGRLGDSAFESAWRSASSAAAVGARADAQG